MAAAFRQFLAERNQGHPIILAGHSQGGGAVLSAGSWPFMLAVFAGGYLLGERSAADRITDVETR